ncbi:MAG: DUF6691 family protein [Anaeromyxobacteraceae bacterium]
MNVHRRNELILAGLGLAFGFAISMSGLSDWGELHRMFTLQDPRLLLAFGGALALSIAGFFLLARRDEIPMKTVVAGTVPGALLFGAGWAIAGACPGAALVQLGEGKWAALATLAGILAGSRLHDRLRKRFGWGRHSCID